jgi:DNA repair ATPase RecN
MKLSKHFLNKEEELKEEASVLEKSLDWWEKEVEQTLDKLDALENLESYSKENIERANEIFRHLEYLLSRTDFEYKNIENMEAKIKNFVKFRKVIENATNR